MTASGNDAGIFFERPLTIVLLVLAIAAFVVPQLPAVSRRRREVAADSED